MTESGLRLYLRCHIGSFFCPTTINEPGDTQSTLVAKRKRVIGACSLTSSHVTSNLVALALVACCSIVVLVGGTVEGAGLGRLETVAADPAGRWALARETRKNSVVSLAVCEPDSRGLSGRIAKGVDLCLRALLAHERHCGECLQRWEIREASRPDGKGRRSGTASALV